MLLGQSTKQPLSNFEPWKPWKYKQLWGLRPDLLSKVYVSLNLMSLRNDMLLVLEWVAWVACLRGYRESMDDIDMAGVLT